LKHPLPSRRLWSEGTLFIHSFASLFEAHPRSAADPISGFDGAIVCGTDNPAGPQNILILKRRLQWITKL
jgi:hypothetical protein